MNDKQERFRAGDINVLKLKNETDCSIALSEIKYAIDRILDDIRCGFGDDDWSRSANYALKELEHKAKMIETKQVSIAAGKAQFEKEQARRDENRSTQSSKELTFLQCFKNATKIMVDDSLYTKIMAMAQLVQTQENSKETE